MWFRKLALAAALVASTVTAGLAQTKQTVTFMALDVTNFRGALEQFIDEFEKQNPDVDIVANFTPQLGAQFLAMLQANNLNDITFIASPRIVPLLSSGKLTPIPADFAATLRDTMWSASLGPISKGDEIFAVPYNFYPNSGIVMYNEKLWKDAGVDPAQAKTWDEFMTLAQAVTKRDADGHMTQSGFSAQQEPFAIYLAWLLQLGGKPFNDDGTAAFNSDAGRAALQLYADIYQKWHVDDYEFGATVDQFNQEKAASSMIGPWYESILAKDHPNIAVGHVKQPPLPGVDPAQPNYWALQEVWSHLISAEGSKKEGVWRFIKFLIQPEIAARWSEFSGEMTAVKAAATLPQVVGTSYIAPYVGAMDYGVTKNIPEYLSSDVVTVLTKMLETVARGGPVQDALDAAERETNRLTARMASH